ncbi:MAG: choice-of-anchor Q domain-containing protein [Thermoguttaceae bacterium]|jgi:hypothetical protein
MMFVNTIVALNYSGFTNDIYCYDYHGPIYDKNRNNIIGLDPGFVTPPIFDESGKLINFGSMNLMLSHASPAINAGNNFYNDLNNDLAGSPRVVDGIVDIGAYEYQGAESEQPATPTITTGDRGIHVS